MAQFRKRGTRLFYKVDGTTVVQVRNSQQRSVIDIAFNNDIILSDALDGTSVVPESEFNMELELANQRIKDQRL